MSLLRPDAIPGAAQSSLLWFQMAYAVWQFIRTAKFFRLFYVLGSSLWHGLDSFIRKRKLILIRDDLDVDQYARGPLENLRSPPPGMTVADIDSYNVEVSFTDPSYTCLTTRHRASHMLMLMNMLHSFKSTDPQGLQFARDDDLLLPQIHLIRRLSFEDAMDHMLSGKGYDTLPQVICFFDYSSRELLNQNFLRFASIWPLILQARNFDFWSIIFSIVIILMDLFSYFANKLWRFVQYWVSRLVKWIILRVSSKASRVFCFTFMATISTRFECRNFVTAKACSKVVKEVLLATHTKIDKRKVAKLDPVSISINIADYNLPSSKIKRPVNFFMNREKYTAFLTPAVSDGGSFSVHFEPATYNISVNDWTHADMAYFLQVCDYCDKLEVPPVKKLDGHDAVCCSFAEIVHGVKSRAFVVCEFKTPHPSLFFT